MRRVYIILALFFGSLILGALLRTGGEEAADSYLSEQCRQDPRSAPCQAKNYTTPEGAQQEAQDLLKNLNP